MPIALTCDCGRAIRVKDELAGRKVRCPACTTIVAVPKPEAPPDAEEEALKLLLDEPDDSSSHNDNTAENELPATDAIQPKRPGPRPAPPPEPPPPEWKWRKKKPAPISIRKPKPKSRGGLFNNVNPNYGVMGTGCFMMLGGVLLFIVGLATGWIIFGGIFLFFSGMGTFFKGLMGRTD